MEMMQIAQAYKQMKSGGNPAQIFQQVAGNNPQAAQIIQAINSGMPVSKLTDQALQQAGMTREQAVEQLKQFGLV